MSDKGFCRPIFHLLRKLPIAPCMQLRKNKCHYIEKDERRNSMDFHNSKLYKVLALINITVGENDNFTI